MTKLPQFKGADVKRRLMRLGFEVDHSGGRHVVMRHPGTKRSVPVTKHASQTVKEGTLRAIIKQAGITIEEFLEA